MWLIIYQKIFFKPQSVKIVKRSQIGYFYQHPSHKCETSVEQSEVRYFEQIKL